MTRAVKANPGVVGWIAVAASVIAADAYAKYTRRPTMSDEFHRNFGWSVVVAAGVFVHLVVHGRSPA